MNDFVEPVSPGSNRDEFYRKASDFDRLTKAEEFELIKDWQKTGNKKAFSQVYLANTKLVYSLARLYRQIPVSRDDLIQEGMVGLAEAINSFDTSEGVPLGSYASQWIRSAFRRYILKNHHIVPFAGTPKQRKLFFKLPQHIPVGRKLTKEERTLVAEKLETTPDQISLIEDRLKITQASLHHNEPDDDFATDGSEVMPVVDESEGPEDLVLSRLEHEKQKARFKRRLYKLTKQERELIYKRYLIEDGEKRPTLKEFSEAFGVTGERVRQIEAKAFKRMESLFKREERL